MEPKRDSYDAIVVGAGMGGLTAAAMLAKSGLCVLLVDQNDRPGGYAQSFEIEGFTFDLAVHLVTGCEEGGMVRSVLEDLDVQDEIEFIRPSTFYRCISPDFVLDVPSGSEGFVEVHAQKFPREKEGVKALVSAMKAIYHEVMNAPPSGLLDLLKMPFTHPHLFKYRNKTFADMLDEFVTDEKLKAALSILWVYTGLPPSRLSAIVMSVAVVTFVEDNPYYVRGGFQQLANALAHGLEKHGGELLLRERVDRIRVEKGKVTGIELEGGAKIGAKVVVSNVSAKQTFGKLVGPSNVGRRYLNRVNRMKPSISAFEVFLGTDLNMHGGAIAHETFAMWSYDLNIDVASSFSETLDETSGRWGMGICAPTLTDPSLAPEGRHVLCLITFAPYNIGKNWDEEKYEAGERLVRRAEVLIPDLSEHIVVKEIITPLDMERRTLNDEGAAYGWEKSLDQIGSKELGLSTPIEGLYLAGHWAGSGAGVQGTMASGKRVLSAILRKTG